MALKPSLNRYVSWSTVLPLLGGEVRSAALPARVACPLCAHNILQVYKDLVVGGQWYWCPKCRFTGDTIELAARAWRLGPEPAVLKLMSAGVPFPPGTDDGAIRDYVDHHVAGRKKVEALWREASACRTPLEGKLALFAARLGIPPVRPVDWAARGGQFVGVTDHAAVTRCFHPDKQPGRGATGDRVFKGRGWGQLVAIPHRDLPGRVRGLLLVGREARYPEDFVYHRAFAPGPDAAAHDHGVALLEAALAPGAPAEDAVFVCTDVVEAVRLQLAHLVGHGQPAPLVGAWGDEPSAAWDMLPRRPVVVFGPEGTPDDAARLVRYARRLGGTAGRAVQAPGQRTTDVLKAAARSAVDWQTRLEDQLRTRPPAEAETVFLKMAFPQGDSARFLRDCAPDARAQIRGVADVAAAVRTVEFGARVVVESDGTWREADKGTLISDVVVRVDRTIYQRRRGRLLFEGTLRRKGAEVAFVVDEAAHRDPGVWLRRACLEGGLGMPNVAPQWHRRLFQLAQLFREATHVETEGVLGWDDSRNLFAFPKFTLAPGGAVTVTDVPAGAAQPGLRFDPPDGLTPEQVARLSDENGATRLLWATAVVVAAGALAPCLGLEPGSAAFSGHAAIHTFVPATTAMGCPVVEAHHTLAITARVLEARRYCNWPVVAAYTDRHVNRDATDLPPGTLCRVGSWTADVLALRGGWAVVSAADRSAALLPIMSYGPAVLPNYLRHFLADHTTLTGNVVSAVLEDMATWFADCGGNARAVRRAASIIRPDDESACAGRFATLVARMYCEGGLPYGGDGRDGPALCPLAGGLLHVPRPGVARVLARKDAPHLDAEAVTRHLAAAGALVDEADHDGHPGWVVREPWWRDHLDRWKTRNLFGLRKAN